MIETLAFGDVEISRAAEGFMADGKSYPADSYVVSMHQPFSGWAKTLLEKQQYPDLRIYPGGPPKRPYDVTAQTLPLLMGVDTVTVKDSFTSNLQPATKYSFELEHTKPADGLAATDVSSWKEVAKDWNAGKPLHRDTRPAISTLNLAAGASSFRRRASESIRPMCRAWTKAGLAGCSMSSASPTPGS